MQETQPSIPCELQYEIHQLTHISSEGNGSFLDLNQERNSKVMRQAKKQAEAVTQNLFNPFTFFGTMQVDVLELEEPKPWLEQIFKKTKK